MIQEDANHGSRMYYHQRVGPPVEHSGIYKDPSEYKIY